MWVYQGRLDLLTFLRHPCIAPPTDPSSLLLTDLGEVGRVSYPGPSVPVLSFASCQRQLLRQAHISQLFRSAWVPSLNRAAAPAVGQPSILNSESSVSSTYTHRAPFSLVRSPFPSSPQKAILSRHRRPELPDVDGGSSLLNNLPPLIHRLTNRPCPVTHDGHVNLSSLHDVLSPLWVFESLQSPLLTFPFPSSFAISLHSLSQSLSLEVE